MNDRDDVTIFAPATAANLGPGFDVLGLALRAVGDRVRARRVDTPGVQITQIVGDDGRLPRQAEENTAGIAAIETLRLAGVSTGVALELYKGMPIGSGLGSSAASAAAAAVAVNQLLGNPLRRSQLIGPCIEAEAMVSGRHADNVAPALLGGLVLVHTLEPLRVQRLPLPEGLFVTVVTPAFVLSTRRARSALPEQIPLSAMVRNSANLGLLLSACYSGDLGLLGRCVVDEIVTPARAALIPGGQAVIDAALRAGALGSSISGAGPSIFAFCHSLAATQRVSAAMVAAFQDAGLPASVLSCPADSPGAMRVPTPTLQEHTT